MNQDLLNLSDQVKIQGNYELSKQIRAMITFGIVKVAENSFKNIDFVDISLPKGVRFQPANHPMGQLIIKYFENVFAFADEDRVSEGQVSVAEQDQIAEMALHYDQRLDHYHNNIEKNKNPISIDLMKSLIYQIIKVLTDSYPNKKKLDKATIKDFGDMLIDAYTDAYQTAYPVYEELPDGKILTQERTGADFIGMDAGIGDTVEMPNQEEIMHLNRENDSIMSALKRRNDALMNLKKRDPEEYQKFLRQERKSLKQDPTISKDWLKTLGL